VWRPGDVKVTIEQDGTPGHGATAELADDGDDGDDGLADDAQPAMADNVTTTTSAVPVRPFTAA